MCGIFAAVGTPVEASALQRVLAVLEHRGPDGNGQFRDDAAPITLVHTRLAVIDLETGAQPLCGPNGNILVANGEIYDFERIRSSLERKGHQFRSKSDSEVILHLYEEYGLRFVDHLRGEFAFLLYDKRKQLLIAARDRFGIKPLYFSRLAEGFAFASEMKAIFASGLVVPRLNVAGLDPLFATDGDRPQFPFDGIEHVAPGSYMLIDLKSGDANQVRYWSPEIPAAVARAAGHVSGEVCSAAASAVLDQLDEAVRLRLRADVPVGLYLSGGLDSAVVGALMRRHLNAPLHSFSISFLGSERSEQEFTRRSAAFLGTNHHELAVTKQMLWDNLEDCLWFTELPFATLAPVGKFLLSAEARKSATVVLNGQGADEVFLGYRRFFQKAIDDTRKRSSKHTRASLRLRRLKLAPFPRTFVENLSLMLFHKSQRAALASARAHASPRADATKPLINEVQEARIAEMPIDILGFLGDRVEMAHSLEVRVPFLDDHLYDVARSIPVDFKIRDGVEKAVLRDAALGILPDNIRLRRKLGFMLTSNKVDFFGEDRLLAHRLRLEYLSRNAFEEAKVFSYRTYLCARLLARIPGAQRVSWLRRLRRNANKLIMYMMQAHILHDIFIAHPRWAKTCSEAPGVRPVEPALDARLASAG